MNHINTKSEEENKARSKFPKVEEGDPVVADEALEATVRELLALRHKMDEDELAASKLKGKIMAAMGSRDKLVSQSGELLATWVTGSSKKDIDYKAILRLYKVAQADIDAFTKYKTASRTFSIEELS